jgi:hypothetical protein
MPGSQLVSIEEQGSDWISGGVGAGALIAAAGGRIDAIEVPDYKQWSRQSAPVVARGNGFI